jgi:uncharacterized protein YjbI with pentapeptide repeats
MQSKRPKPTTGIEPPQLPKRLPPGALPGGQLADQGSYVKLALTNIDWSNQEVDDVYFEAVLLKHVILNGARLPSLQIVDARFDGCDLTGTECEKGHLNRVEFVGSRITGAKLLNASIANVLFKDCSGEFAMFWESTFESVRFENCSLSEASFLGANLSGVVFDRCDLSNANLQGTTLVGTDFRSSKLEGLRVGSKELQGAIISPSQAAHVVSLLGITVKWD